MQTMPILTQFPEPTSPEGQNQSLTPMAYLVELIDEIKRSEVSPFIAKTVINVEETFAETANSSPNLISIKQIIQDSLNPGSAIYNTNTLAKRIIDRIAGIGYFDSVDFDILNRKLGNYPFLDKIFINPTNTEVIYVIAEENRYVPAA